MKKLSRRGAEAVCRDLDRIANLFENDHEALGVPKRAATRMYHYCDQLAEHVEKYAARLASDDGEAEDDAPEKGEAEDTASKKSAKRNKRAEDETGGSVSPIPNSFDPNVIGDETNGPLDLVDPIIQPWIEDFYTSIENQELRNLMQSGALNDTAARSTILTKNAKVTLARMTALASGKRTASVSKLSSMENLLKMIHAKVSASDLPDVKALAADIKKQIDAVGKIRDTLLLQEATYFVDASTIEAVSAAIQAFSDQLPYLQHVIAGVDSKSPLAMMEFQKMVAGDDSVKKLVSMAATILTSAVSSLKSGEDTKTASKKRAAEEAPKEEAPKKDEEEAPKKEASKSKKSFRFTAAEEEAPKDEEEASEEESETASKKASHGYDLFA